MKVQIDHPIGSIFEGWTRRRFYLAAATAVVGVALAATVTPWALLAYVFVVPLVLIGVADAIQTRHTIPRNFPLIGRLRYFFESIRPEIRQYFIESDSDDWPFSREKRSLVFQRAKGVQDTLPFGTRHDVYANEYEWLQHSLNPCAADDDALRVTVGGKECKQPYSASILNVSAMSYGSLSKNAVLALNEGARRGGFAHNTGEGGLSPHHLAPGGDIIWQIGTGYFGCRDAHGKFDAEKFRDKSAMPSVKMIELKLSQGAKPGHGGILPAAKVSKEISEIRGVPMGVDVLSPPGHSSFSTPRGLIEFVATLRELSGGKPVGFKLCMGNVREWFGVVKAMLETGILPDFITVDGAEGGTGAAPLEFSNSVGMPCNDGLNLVHGALVGTGLRGDVKLFAAGKITSGFHILSKMALGADACNSARAMMFALGCIQALKCNTNMCPTGVATNNKNLVHGLVVPDKAARVHSFHAKTVHSVGELLGAAGLRHPRDLRPELIYRRVSMSEIRTFAELYPVPAAGSLLAGDAPAGHQAAWFEASPEWF